MKTKVIKKNYLNNMGYKNVRILVRALTFETAEEKALNVFSSEGNKVSDGTFFLGQIKGDEPSIFAGYEVVENEDFINSFNQQFQDFKKNIQDLIFENSDTKNLESVRNYLSDKYRDYLSQKITHKTLIYDGESFGPLLLKKKLEQFPNEYFIVVITYKI